MALVAIIGRPNVGKSTFFNRMVGRRQAIVDEYSGVTRDRHYGTTDWGGREFSLIDTGGYVSGTEDRFEKEIFEYLSLTHPDMKISGSALGQLKMDRDYFNQLANTFRSPHLWEWTGSGWSIRYKVQN
jgi:ribosome biogenesis GTPase A